MGFRQLGAALLVAVALSIVLTSSALAAAVTEDVKWFTGTAPGTELSGSETVSAEAVEPMTLTTEAAGAKYKFEAKKLSCVECKIENVGGVAIGSGKLKFEEVSVKEPAGCSIASSITTAPLSWQADWMAASGTEPDYWKFAPTKGETTEFAKFEITGCALATSLVARGSLGFQDMNSTGTLSVSIQLITSPSIQATTGFSLTSGTKTFSASISTNFRMSGTRFMVGWGVHF